MIEIRGEVYLPFDRFEQMNEAARRSRASRCSRIRATQQRARFDSSTRRSRQRGRCGSTATPSRCLRWLPSLRDADGVLERLREWGIPVAPHRVLCASLEDVHTWAHDVEHKVARQLDFAIDGGVVKVDSLALQDELGIVGGREPRWAIARKFAPDIAETTLIDIEVNVGRTGTLNPFAVLDPVEIGGTQVKLATLHNFDLIAKKDLRIGDIVQVKRAGEVIPQIIGPVPEKRDATNPAACRCRRHTARRADGVVEKDRRGHALLPELGVPGAAARGARAFRVARGDGHSRALVCADRAAHRCGLVHDAVRPLRPEREAHRARSVRRQERGALVEAIAASKAATFITLLFGLGIGHVGQTAARRSPRISAPWTRSSMRPPTTSSDVRGIGDTIAQSLRPFSTNSAPGS